MDLSAEHFRAYVFLELQRQGTPSEIYAQLQETRVSNIPCRATVFNWCKQFQEGLRTTLSDAPRSGRPTSSSSDQVIAKVKDAIFSSPRLSTRQLSDLLYIPRTSVNRILREELLLRKVCSVWVPHSLTAQNKECRVKGATDLQVFFKAHSEDDLMRLYVTQDETWVLFNDIAPKEKNKVWIPPGQPRPQIVRQQLTWQKTMVLLAFTCNNKFNVEVTQRCETVDAQRYTDFVHHTGEKWRTLRRDPVHLNEVWWQHDNARPHTSALTNEFFARRHIQRIPQPPYSPDLNLCDRFVFKFLKKSLRETTFSTANEVKTASLHVLKSIPEDRMRSELNKLRDHCQRVIDIGGGYVTD